MSKPQNIQGLFKDKKTRNVIIASGAVAGLVGLVSMSMMKPAAVDVPPELKAVQQVNPTVQAVRTEGEMDPRYRALFDEQNRKKADIAEQQGSSAFLNIPDDPVENEIEQPKPAPKTRETSLQRSADDRAGQQRKAAEPHPAVMALMERSLSTKTMVVQVNHALEEDYAVEKVAETISSRTPDEESALKPKTLYAAGAIVAATIKNTLNSDNPGPVIAQIHSGPYAGATVIGQMSSGSNGVGITAVFNRLSTKDGTTYEISAQALSEGELSNMLASDVDHKIFNRFVLRPLAYFAKGMSDAIMSNVQSGEIVTNADTNVTTITQRELDRKEQTRVGLGVMTGELVKETEKQDMTRPTTVVNKNEVIGIVFLESLYADSDKQR